MNQQKPRFDTRPDHQRIVITGMGAITPLGLDTDSTWQRLIKGESGIQAITDFDTTDFRAKIAGQIKDIDISQYMSAKDARRFDVFVQYGVAAAAQALKDADLIDDMQAGKLTNVNPDRVGVVIGSGIGGITTIEETAVKLNNEGARKVSPFFVPSSIVNMAAGQVAIRHGIRGANLAISTACTTSTHAIGLAARLIAYGDADVMVAGGCEKASSPMGIGGFSAMQALSTRNDEPTRASRPFDKDRDGFVLGDGAGVVVLESLAHAKARKATILAELIGFGMSDDAVHITAPPEDGEGARRAMEQALADGGIDPSEVGYINAHGTSTMADVIELGAVERLLGDAAGNVVMSSTKSSIGHLLGAAGAVEAIFCILAIRDQI